MNAADRTNQLLDAALIVAVASGWQTLTRERIAVAAGVAPSLVTVRLGSAEAIRRAVMRQAIHRRVLAVVAEGLARRHASALRAPQDVKDAAAALVAGR